jgi:hypothetical protein
MLNNIQKYFSKHIRHLYIINYKYAAFLNFLQNNLTNVDPKGPIKPNMHQSIINPCIAEYNHEKEELE